MDNIKIHEVIIYSEFGGGLCLDWESSIGFGQLTLERVEGELVISSENLSKDSVKQILCALVDQTKVVL